MCVDLLENFQQEQKDIIKFMLRLRHSRFMQKDSVEGKIVIKT